MIKIFKNIEDTFPVFLFLYLLIMIFPERIFASGGACTFSDDCHNATNFVFCAPVNADNSGCQACGLCDYGDNTITSGPGSDYFGVADHCDSLYNQIYSTPTGCAEYTYTDPCGECICTFSNWGTDCMGVATTSSVSYLCGTPENTSYSRMCVPATFIENSESCDFLFSTSGISCNGGAATLQWGIYPSAAICSTLATNFPNGTGMLFCENSSTSDQNINANLTPGSCYLLFFDGNAEANCSWTFNVTPPTPVATFTGPTTGCVGVVQTFTSTSSCYNNLSWSNTGNGDTSTAGTYSVTWASPGTYSICLNASTNSAEFSACSGANYSDIECKTITISSSICCTQPILTLNLSGSLASSQSSNDGTATATVNGGTPPYSYSWNDALGQSTLTATNLLPGYYHFKVSDSNGCTIDDSVLVDFVYSIKNSVFYNSFKIYADPINKQISIDFKVNEPENFEVTILNTSGKIVYQRSFINVKEDKFYINYSTFSDGIYFAKITSGNSSYSKKLVVLK